MEITSFYRHMEGCPRFLHRHVGGLQQKLSKWAKPSYSVPARSDNPFRCKFYTFLTHLDLCKHS